MCSRLLSVVPTLGVVVHWQLIQSPSPNWDDMEILLLTVEVYTLFTTGGFAESKVPEILE